MPRIRTWHRVAHDFNRDPEVRILRQRFPDWMAYVWLEMLSIGDRKRGFLKGELEAIAEGLSHVSMTKRPSLARKHIINALHFMAKCKWIEIQTEGVLILKYRDFRPRQEHIETPQGIREKSLLEEKRQEETRRDKDKDLSSDPASRPSAPPIDPQLHSWLEKTEYLKCLGNGKHGTYWKTVVAAYDGYPFLFFEEEIKLADAWCAANPSKRPTDRGMPRFFRSWLERAVERGRKNA